MVDANNDIGSSNSAIGISYLRKVDCFWFCFIAVWQDLRPNCHFFACFHLREYVNSLFCVLLVSFLNYLFLLVLIHCIAVVSDFILCYRIISKITNEVLKELHT